MTRWHTCYRCCVHALQILKERREMRSMVSVFTCDGCGARLSGTDDRASGHYSLVLDKDSGWAEFTDSQWGIKYEPVKERRPYQFCNIACIGRFFAEPEQPRQCCQGVSA